MSDRTTIYAGRAPAVQTVLVVRIMGQGSVQEYKRADGGWTRDPNNARNFGTRDNAVAHCTSDDFVAECTGQRVEYYYP